MRARNPVLVLLALVIAPSPCRAQFEGVIRIREIDVDAAAFMQATGTTPETIFEATPDDFAACGESGAVPGQIDVQNVIFRIKGARVRMESPEGKIGGPGGFAFIDMERGLFRIVMPSSSAMVEWTFDDLARLIPDFEAPDINAAPEPSGRATVLDRPRTVGGFLCDSYRIEVEGDVQIGCLASSLLDAGDVFWKIGMYARTMTFQDAKEPDESAREGQMAREIAALLSRHGFPVLMQSLEDDRFSYAEVVEVERTTVDESLFDEPQGLLKIPVIQLMGGG